MADNITVTQGTGTTMATDDVSGVHYSKVKLIDSTAESVTPVGTSSNPLYVQHASAQSVSVSGTVTVDASGSTVPVSNAGLTELAAAINTNRVDVNIANDAVGIGGGTQYTEGDIDATITGTAIMFESNTGTNAVSAVSNSTPLPVGDAGGTLTVDGTVTANLSATDNAVLDSIDAAVNGTLTVNGSGVTQPISAASLPLPSGASTAAKQPALGTAGAASSDVITIQGIASMTAVKVDGSAVTQPVSGSLTVDLGVNNDVTVTSGSITATQGTATNLKTQAEAYQGGSAVAAGNPLQVSLANTAANSTAVKVNVASGGIASGAIAAGAIAAGATSIADNEDVASAASDRLVKVAARRTDALTANDNTSADGDYTQFKTDNFGALWTTKLAPYADLATMATAHVHKYYTASAPTDGIVWSPAAGKRWYLTHLSINVSAATTVTVEDDKAGGDDPVYAAQFAANSGVVLTFPDVPLFSGEDAADLIVTSSAGTVYVTAVGYEI